LAEPNILRATAPNMPEFLSRLVRWGISPNRWTLVRHSF
jgi:hypothetical protein